MRGAVTRTAEPAPWWASPWAQRLTAPREAVLVPMLIAVVLAWLAGRWLRRLAAREPRPPVNPPVGPGAKDTDARKTGPGSP